MRQDGILGRQQWQYATPFHVFSDIDIQDIFVPKKVLEWIWVYYVNDISMVPEKRSKFSRFPGNHWLVSFIVYAFHKTTFFQLGVNKAEQKLQCPYSPAGTKGDQETSACKCYIYTSKHTR